MASRLISSLVRCSIPRVSFISRSQFYSTTPLISRTLILRNLISKPCCAISIKYASSKSLGSLNDKIKCADKDLLRVLESVMDEKYTNNMMPYDFHFETIDYPGCESITLKSEYDCEQILAIVSMDNKHRIEISVIIDKRVGHALKFRCNLTPNNFEVESVSLISSENSNEGSSNGFEISSMLFKRPKNFHEDYFQRRPFLCDSDERLQSVFQECLAARSFEKSIYDYLHFLLEQKRIVLHGFKEFLEK